MAEPEPDAFDDEGIEQDVENDDCGKAADDRRNRRISWVASCLVGIFVAAAVAGGLTGLWRPKSQTTAFLISFFLLAPLLSILGRWFFLTHPDQIAKRLQEEDRGRGIVDDDGDYIEDEEEHQDEDRESIHPG
jgi:hypothetical protein